MIIRKAFSSDITEILRVYEAAREYMAASGNPNQWGRTHPPRELLESDIEKGQLYVGVGGDGGIRLCFALVPGDDPTYGRIDGAWLNDGPYAAIHRVASDGAERGTFQKCLDFCRGQYENLRIDTHRDNATMRHVLEKSGFTRCGIIYLANGDPRIAYQLSRR